MKKLIKHLLPIFLLILAFALTIQASGPDLISISNLNNGDSKSGIFEIDGVALNTGQVSKVALKIGNGPWEAAAGVANWSYTVNSRQIVLSSHSAFDSSLGELVTTYQYGPYYGNLNITVRTLDAYDNKLSEKTIAVNIIPEMPVANQPSGWYDADVDLSLQARPEVSIYYTLDGSIPTQNSLPYSNNLVIKNDTTLMVAAISKDNYVSNVLQLNINFTVANKPAFTIEYFLDSALSNPVGWNRHLKAGNYYLKITTDKDLQTSPTITITAEGTANNVVNAPTEMIDTKTYKYLRTISYDPAAAGASWKISF